MYEAEGRLVHLAGQLATELGYSPFDLLNRRDTVKSAASPAATAATARGLDGQASVADVEVDGRVIERHVLPLHDDQELLAGARRRWLRRHRGTPGHTAEARMAAAISSTTTRSSQTSCERVRTIASPPTPSSSDG